MKSKIPSPDRNVFCITLHKTPNLTTTIRSRTVYPMIQPPNQIVRGSFVISKTEPRENLLPMIRPSIPVGIFQIPKIWCRNDIDTTIPATNPGRPLQPFRKNSTCLVMPIAILVFEQTDAAIRPVTLTMVRRKLEVLGNIH